MQIELDEDVVEVLAVLKTQAAELHLPLEVYLRQFAVAGARTPTSIALSDAEFDSILDEMAEGSDEIPSLPSDFSRADIYADHD